MPTWRCAFSSTSSSTSIPHDAGPTVPVEAGGGQEIILEIIKVSEGASMANQIVVDPSASVSPFAVGINERLPAPQLLLLGLQNVFGMTGMFVFPGLLG